jgi:glucose-6-phosphate isomerase
MTQTQWVTEIKQRAGRLPRGSARTFLQSEQQRLQQHTLRASGITLDSSKEAIDADSLGWLNGLAEQLNLPAAMQALFAAVCVNPSEGQAALHWALRMPESLLADRLGSSEATRLQRGLLESLDFAHAVRTGTKHSESGDTYTAVVHLGIGGSDFGPRLLADALEDLLDPNITLRFAANIDPIDVSRALKGLDPRRTLICVVSKSWSTRETLTNAGVALAWLKQGGVTEPSLQMVGISARPDRVRGHLGPFAEVFDMPKEIGGRYSLCSASSLACMIGVGPDAFRAFLAGAHALDMHALEAPLRDNLAIRLALLDAWRRIGMGLPTRAVLAYSRRLRLLPAYLQQLEMESNGKSVDLSGRTLHGPGAPVLWGGEGTIGQHSYHQLLHQGQDIIPAEFILARADDGDPVMRRVLQANALAQAEAMLVGKSAAQIERELLADGMAPEAARVLAAQKAMPGGQPSSIIALDRADAFHLGALIALYEHRTYVSAVLLGLNAFDQWGVELGKVMANVIEAELAGGLDGQHDPSTSAWIEALRG